MSERDENHEDNSFKVTDRRKFNADGSVRDGIVLDQQKPEPPPVKEPDQPEPEPIELPQDDTIPDLPIEEPPLGDEEDEIPGIDDPASFVNFLSTLATNAAAALGAVPHPATGQRSLDIETGKYWLDVLGMLHEKTKGNLHQQETRLLEGLLGDLRMQYVQIVRAQEEQLKAQAAKKFSDSDILGKRS